MTQVHLSPPARDHLEAWEERVRLWEESQDSSAWRRVLRNMRRNKMLVIGGLLAVVLIGLGLLGPVISGRDYAAQSLQNAYRPPFSEGHVLGTDHLGRDLAVRIFVGLRISFLVAFLVSALALLVGLVVGMVGGFLGGWTDRILKGTTDFLWGFPLILVAVLLAGGLGRGLFPVVLAVGVINLAAIARVVRGEVLVLKEREFVEAALAGGVYRLRIMWRHLFPNVLAPSLVLASYYVAVAIVAEAGLSFIGLGAQPPLPSLGKMVAEGRNYLLVNHWETTLPGITIALLVLSVSLIGDGLRDVFDPRLRHEAKGVEE
ncbi:MAG: ABC transporter permease [Acidimicrobiia bacterium]